MEERKQTAVEATLTQMALENGQLKLANNALSIELQEANEKYEVSLEELREVKAKLQEVKNHVEESGES